MDTQPEEEKSLIEEKLKKVTTEKAPVAGQRTGAGAAGASSQDQNLIRQALRSEGNIRSFNELSEILGHRVGGGSNNNATGSAPGSGAAAAAGVLTAVDEDGEGDEEAPLPREFEYFSDGGEDEE